MSATHIAVVAVLSLATSQMRAAVTVEPLPESGLQPQVVAETGGTLHLIYLVGDPRSADIHYRRREAGEKSWSGPMRVNSQPGSAIAIGTIRGPQLALGPKGRVHVCWNGSNAAEPKPASGGAPMLYSRLSDDGQRFEPQRNLMTSTHELDGGGSIAATGDGRVLVVWHAAPVGGQGGETNRAVFGALSTDDGGTFAKEHSVSPAGTGACGCCGLKAFANQRGEIFVLYRTARSVMQRDMMLLGSRDQGETFERMFLHPWKVGTCPMSSASLAQTATETWAAWETDGRIHATRFASAREKGLRARAVNSSKGAKHPVVAANSRGETLLVWTEGTGWQRGGRLAWQPFDAEGEPAGEAGHHDGIPVWSFAAAFARPDGTFVIVY